MVLRPPDSIFKGIVAGRLRLRPEDFAPRPTKRGSIPPRFPEGRTAKLRSKLLAVGIDPVSVGLPPERPPNTRIFIPPDLTYGDACRELKYDFVKQQLGKMEQTVREWRQNKKLEEAKLAKKKLPF